MSAWTANLVALFAVTGLIWLWALAAMWRVGAWRMSRAERLTYQHGLQISSLAPEIACHRDDGVELHLGFRGQPSMIVFGGDGCEPCIRLLDAALHHPATKRFRHIYVANQIAPDFPAELRDDWETCTFVDERATRDRWDAPVSPYFHLIDADGHVREKGTASHSTHLDRLLALRFDGSPPPAHGQSFFGGLRARRFGGHHTTKEAQNGNLW